MQIIVEIVRFRSTGVYFYIFFYQKELFFERIYSVVATYYVIQGTNAVCTKTKFDPQNTQNQECLLRYSTQHLSILTVWELKQWISISSNRTATAIFAFIKICE